MRGVWETLAEAVGLDNEGSTNWSKISQRRNMARYGTQDRNRPVDPMGYFNPKGTGSAQRQATAAAMAPDMTPRPGGLQIPSGTDRPGQGNPLLRPTPAQPRTAMAKTPSDDEELLALLAGDET